MTCRDRRLKKLPRQPSQKERNTQVFTGLEHKPNVLMHPLNTKVGGKVTFQYERSLVADQSALGGAVVQNLQHELRVHAALGREDHALIERHQDIGEDQVLGEFGLQAHARATAEVDL